MVTSLGIITAINKELIVRWPNRPVYRGNVPKDFERPSFLLEAVSETRRDANVQLIKITSYYTVTAFEKIDEYKNMDSIELLETQTEVLDLFKTGSLAVSDRVLKVSASGGGVNDGEAYVDIQFEYMDSKYEEEKPAQLMGGVNTTIKMEG